MEAKEEVRTLPRTVIMQGQLGQVSGPYQVSSQLTKRVLLRPEGVEGTPGELGTITIISS